MPRLNERFAEIPEIVAGTNTQYTADAGTAVAIAAAKVDVPTKPPTGLTYRFKLAGTKTGTNATHTVLLTLGGTTIMTLTADATTAVDWVAEFTVRFTSATAQKVMGTLSGAALDAMCDYAAGTVDCTAGAALQTEINGHASDSVTCEMCTVEKWVM